MSIKSYQTRLEGHLIHPSAPRQKSALLKPALTDAQLTLKNTHWWFHSLFLGSPCAHQVDLNVLCHGPSPSLLLLPMTDTRKTPAPCRRGFLLSLKQPFAALQTKPVGRAAICLPPAPSQTSEKVLLSESQWEIRHETSQPVQSLPAAPSISIFYVTKH